MRNKISDLRNHLFSVLEELTDPDSNYDIAKAKVVADIAQVVVNSAKIENDFIRITGASHGTGFIEEQRSEIKKISESN
jgi:hypothetical protein